MPKQRRAQPRPDQVDWPALARQVGERVHLAQLEPGTLSWLSHHAAKDELWGVAVSGGADSLALLLLLWTHFPKKRPKITVLHFDHATRPDSAEDAQFVAALAKGLKVKFVTARRTGGGPATEAALRDARWNFFREQLAAAKARIIFLGHQRGDIAETMLMRLARGSGAGGLCAPRPVREFADGLVVLRPLLNLDHDELCATLKAAGVSWSEDSSNTSDAHLRNRVRNQVIPAWQSVMGARDLAAGVARSRVALEEDDDALESYATAALAGWSRGQPLSLKSLAGQPRAVWRRTLHRWLGASGAGDNLNARAFDTLLDAALAGQPGRWSAGPGRWLFLNDNELSLSDTTTGAAAQWTARTFKPGDAVSLPNGARLESALITPERKLLTQLSKGKVNPAIAAFISLSTKSAGERFRVRLWQPGDRYRPLGAPGRRKLQDLFTDKKIPLRERRLLPVVCNVDDEPLWAPGLPPAQDRRITTTTRQAMGLTYRPPEGKIND